MSTFKIKLKGIWETREVFLNDELLDPKPSQRAYNHSPDGFNWGYGGSGRAQLALAVVLWCVDVKSDAIRLHQRFKWDFITSLPQTDFEIEIDINAWLKKQKLWEKLTTI